MKGYVLSELPPNTGRNLAELLDEAKRLRSQREGRIYTTHIRGDKCFDVVTASKQVYLELGRLSFGSQVTLVTCLDHLFDTYGHEPFLLQITGDRRALLVSMSCEAKADLVTFTLAPTH